jgi:hypothetical protein
MRPSRAASQAPAPSRQPNPIEWNGSPFDTVQDFTNYWSNPSFTIDGNTATFATSGTPDSPLIFSWSDSTPRLITHVRIWGEIISPPTNVPITLLAYDDDLQDFVLVGNSIVLTHNTWTIIPLPYPMNCDGLFISFNTIGTSADGLNEVQVGYQPPT